MSCGLRIDHLAACNMSTTSGAALAESSRCRLLRTLSRRPVDSKLMHAMEKYDLYPLLSHSPNKRRRKNKRPIQYFECRGGTAEPRKTASVNSVVIKSPQEAALAKQAKEYVNQIKNNTKHFQAFAILLQSKVALREINAGVHELFAVEHPELLGPFLPFMASNAESGVGKPKAEPEPPNILRGRRSGMDRLDCVNHEMLLGLRKLLTVEMTAQDFDDEMEVYQARSTQVEISSTKAILSHNDCFHASSYMPMFPVDMDIDSDNDVDETWIEADDRVLLDQFKDVGKNDKGFMRLWNRFKRENLLMVSDNALIEFLPAFIKQHQAVLSKQFRTAFTLHLLTFWEMGLLDNKAIEQFHMQLDAVCLGQQNKMNYEPISPREHTVSSSC